MKKRNELLNMKPIKDYENYYITPEGEIFSTLRHLWLAGGISSNGYRSVTLQKDKVQKTFEFHTLVYDTFNGTTAEDRNGLVVDHIDHCKTNNRLDNLQLVTQKENIQRSIRHKKKIMMEYTKGRECYYKDGLDKFLEDMFF